MKEGTTYLIGVTSSLYEDWQIFETGYEYRIEQSALDIATLANKNEELKKSYLMQQALAMMSLQDFGWESRRIAMHLPR